MLSAFSISKEKVQERGERYLAGDKAYLSPQLVSDRAKHSEESVLLERSFATVLEKLLEKPCLASPVSCMEEQTSRAGLRFFDRDGLMMFADSKFISEEPCLNLNCCDDVLSGRRPLILKYVCCLSKECTVVRNLGRRKSC